MFLSSLLIDVGDNPDRPRPGRLWLKNLYRVHQRLCMAFPQDQRRNKDPEMLQPYAPEDFAHSQTRVPRDASAGFLFRVDPIPGGNAVIVVLSALKPDWNYAFGLIPGAIGPNGHPIGNAGHLLATPPTEPRPFKMNIESGRKYRFRLLANPVRRISKNSLDAQGQPIDPKWIGKHVPVPPAEASLWKWLEDRAEPNWNQRKRKPDETSPGFRIAQRIAVLPGFIYVKASGNHELAKGEGKQLRSARYDGILEVTDPAAFTATLAAGIGPAKAFGCGLLSLAPV